MLSIVSCTAGKKEAPGVPVDFQILSGYFVSNTYDLKDEYNLITVINEDQMNTSFGMATTMNTAPTPVDFTKDVVVAVALLPTNIDKNMTVSKIEKSNEVLKVYVNILDGEKKSFTQTPVTLVSLPRLIDVSQVDLFINEEKVNSKSY